MQWAYFSVQLFYSLLGCDSMNFPIEPALEKYKSELHFGQMPTKGGLLNDQLQLLHTIESKPLRIVCSGGMAFVNTARFFCLNPSTSSDLLTPHTSNILSIGGSSWFSI